MPLNISQFKAKLNLKIIYIFKHIKADQEISKWAC